MKKLHLMVAAISSMVALGSCSEQVMNEEIGEGQSLLRVQTRSTTPPDEGRVYVFNSDGDCVRLLSTNEGGQLASTNLVAGTYTVYAVGGEDLSVFTLPSQDDASASSVIGVAEGKTMGDLLMKSDNVTLTDGNTSNLDLELERQVIKLSEVTIKKVPTDVNKVEVRVASLYQSIQLDGTYSGTTEASVELTKSSDNTTWTNVGDQPFGFPSNGNPTITVIFTKSSEVKQYAYQASEPFTANHQIKIEGTFSEEQGAVLSGTLTSEAWGEDASTSFNFNEDNEIDGNDDEPSTDAPVAGQLYLGYYVVSVNTTDKTAVLLRKTQDKGYSYMENITAKNAKIAKPAGVTCGDWRFPTADECRTFLSDTHSEPEYAVWYYCQTGETLQRMKATKSTAGVITIDGPYEASVAAAFYYRPVIDIQY